MSGNLRIRKFEESDCHQVSAMIRDNLRYVNSRDYSDRIIKNMLDLFSPEYIVQLSAKRNMYVALVDHVIVGTVSLEADTIYTVFVDMRHHHSGIGRKLIDFVERIAVVSGESSLKLPSSITAQKFYEKLGFREMEVVESEQYGKDIIMIKNLTAVITRSEEISLRRTKLDDLDYVTATEQDPESKDFITVWSREQHEAAMHNNDFLHLIIEDSKQNRMGYVILHGLLNPSSCYEILRINLSVRDKGYGKKTLNLLKKYLFNHLNAHRVWLDVRARNQRAIHLYKSVGFQEEGILRECIKTEDSYDSLILMGLLEREYFVEQDLYRGGE